MSDQQPPNTTPAPGRKWDANHAFYGLTDREWRHLIMAAYENLPTDTTIEFNDIDAILTWVLPIYNDMIGRPE